MSDTSDTWHDSQEQEEEFLYSQEYFEDSPSFLGSYLLCDDLSTDQGRKLERRFWMCPCPS